ncbi:MAG: hypothetical protein AB7P04_00600 [Bacteriovoracia bacterium]
MIRHFGPSPAIQHTAEAMTIEGIREFLRDGFGPTYGLPVFKGFNHETPIAKLRETFVYTHYLPGDSYLSWIPFRLLGGDDSTIPYARMLPLLCTLAAVLFLILTAAREVVPAWPWSRAALALPLFLAPAIYQWGLTLVGVSYADALTLAGLALGMRKAVKTPWWWALGFAGIYVQFTSVFVICASPLVGRLLRPERLNWRRGLRDSFVVGLGILAGYAVHFTQVALFLASFSDAWQDQIATYLGRSGGAPVPLLKLVFEYSQHVAGFFRIGAFQMLALSFLAAWLYLGPRHRRAQFAAASGLALVASYVWIVLMRHSAVVHYFIFPHVFVLLYACWAVILVSVIAQRAQIKDP